MFRFSGNPLERGTTKSGAPALDFADGDTLVFANYDRGTFKARRQGREPRSGSSCSPRSKALDKASGDVSVAANRKTGALTVEIDQGAATHKIVLADMAHDFLGL